MDRKYLRKKIQDLLKAANIEGLGTDIFSMRSIPSNIENLPIALIYPNTETITRFDEAPKRYMRSLNVVIEVITLDDNDECLADDMDRLASDVEKAIEDDIEISGCVESIELQSVNYTTVGEGQSPVGSVIMSYQIEYITEPRSKFTHPDFNTGDVTWHANDHLDDDTKDSIDLNP